MLLVALGTVLTSCSPSEEKDIFDQNASERLSNTIQSYKDILVDQGGKWAMQYFTTEDEPGFVYLMTFQENGSVTISGNNKYISKLTLADSEDPSYGSETSLYDVIGDDGPVLTFNTYNTYFHIFSTPEDIPGTDTDETGYGHNGDYEFDLMKYSGDTIYLEGKKHGADCIMTRLASDIDDQTYLNEVVALTDSFFNAKIPTVYVNFPSGYRYVITDGASLTPKFYPWDGDEITESTDPYSIIITHDGMNFVKSVELVDSIRKKANDPDSIVSFQHFVRQADGSLVCTENSGVTIDAGELNKVFTHQSVTWRVNTTRLGGIFETIYNSINSQLRSNFSKSSINYLQFAYNASTGAYLFTFKLNRSGGRQLTCTLNYTVTTEGEQTVIFSFDGTGDSNALTVLGKCPALQEFIDELAKGVVASSSSALAPTSIKLASPSGDDDYFYVNMQ